MRNIKEVFVFPKIWYRRSLARRLFLGEEPTSNNFQSHSNRNSQSPPPPPKQQSTARHQHDYHSKVHNRSFESNGKQQRKRDANYQEANVHRHGANNSPKWQTLVLVSINLSELDVRMNVGNVMGHVSWTTTNARSISKVSISSFGPKKMQFTFVLDSSRLFAEGGSNGCMARVQDISSFGMFLMLKFFFAVY